MGSLAWTHLLWPEAHGSGTVRWLWAARSTASPIMQSNSSSTTPPRGRSLAWTHLLWPEAHGSGTMRFPSEAGAARRQRRKCGSANCWSAKSLGRLGMQVVAADHRALSCIVNSEWAYLQCPTVKTSKHQVCRLEAVLKYSAR